MFCNIIVLPGPSCTRWGGESWPGSWVRWTLRMSAVQRWPAPGPGIPSPHVHFIFMHLKVQCHEIFNAFLYLKKLHLSPYQKAKTVSRIFSFSRRYSRKTCARVVVTTLTTWPRTGKQRRGQAIIEICDRISLQNQKVRETVLPCSYGAQVESFKQKNDGRKSRDNVHLSSDF